jgi:hypothetical protein
MNCEIEFLPVGDGCKTGDAIVVRYGEVNAWELMVIDGGNLDSGKRSSATFKIPSATTPLSLTPS